MKVPDSALLLIKAAVKMFFLIQEKGAYLEIGNIYWQGNTNYYLIVQSDGGSCGHGYKISLVSHLMQNETHHGAAQNVVCFYSVNPQTISASRSEALAALKALVCMVDTLKQL